MTRKTGGTLAILMLAMTSPALAQGSGDSLRLGPMHREAVSRDPRQRQFQLLSSQSELRQRNLSAERLPSITAQGTAQYQSDVFEAPTAAGSGFSFPSPSHDTYDTRLNLEQPIIEPSIGPRKRVEEAQLAESEAHVRTQLFGLRQEVNEAFFVIALLAERRGILEASIADLTSRLRETAVRVREGAALPGDTASIQATLLERRQDQVELDADRGAALQRLSELLHRPVSGADHPVLPDLTADVTQARSTLGDLRGRPEYEEFARIRDRLVQQEDVVSAEQKIRVSAFGRVGYGRPGLNPVSDDFDSYWVTGLQLSWAPWDWGSSGRERQALLLQRDIVAADEAAFTSGLTRSIQKDLATMDRLDSTLAMDDQIIALRERVEHESLLRFREGEVTASDYLDRTTDVLEARLARATHRVEQVQARARFLTTLGLEIR